MKRAARCETASGSEQTIMSDPFHARDVFETGAGRAGIYRLTRLENAGLTCVATLPYSIRVLLEAVLRNCDGYQVTEDDVHNLASWQPVRQAAIEVPFKPAHVVLQDFTGVPAVVDLATMRSAMKRLGGDPKRINPLVPVDLVIDHSVQVDRFGSPEALAENIELEFQRNRERYEFLRWGRKRCATSASCRRAWESFIRSTWSFWQNVSCCARTRRGRWPCQTRSSAPTVTRP